MMPRSDISNDPLQRDRIVVVAEGFDDSDFLGRLRRRYPDWNVAVCDSYLTGIVEATRHETRVVIAGVDPSLARLDDAIVGLRKAAGPDAKLLLYCAPDTEPVARALLASGADDYLLSPLIEEELDSLLGCSHRDPCRTNGHQPASLTATSMEELTQLASILKNLGGSGTGLVRMLARLIRTAVPARGVSVVVAGTSAVEGEPPERPVFSVPIVSDGRIVGQVCVGEPVGGAFSTEHADKLTHYATLAGFLLQTASSQRRWREMAYTDELSGLPNRRYLYERLDEVLDRAAVDRLSVTVLLFDVDDFKTYNDEFGHEAGDEVIRLTGQLFREHCREQDVVTRYGGDEFAVVFWDPEGPRVAGSKHPDTALAVLERFTRALRIQNVPKLGASTVGKVTISGGLATYPWDGSTRDDLLRRADEGLHAAKRAGKNRIFLIGEHSGEEAPQA